MHAFIVRPFGIKKGIDFDRVESELIRPALQQLGCSGGTTGEFIQQGNIRSDMFEQLLIADLVVADISIHNANTFYELGIRHAFRDKRTFLIRSQGDEVPFDLKTDRYLSYDAADPAACLPVLVKALQATWASQHQDSPVFQLLPGLPPADPGKFLVVPLDFHEELARAESAGDCGNLQLLSAEMDGLAWKTAGLRLIGNAQFRCKDWQGARVTWEKVRGYDETDLEANTLLGTVYQRLDDLVRADQALKRALHNTREASSGWHRAELYALMGRNAKTLWEPAKNCADFPLPETLIRPVPQRLHRGPQPFLFGPECPGTHYHHHRTRRRTAGDLAGRVRTGGRCRAGIAQTDDPAR